MATGLNANTIPNGVVAQVAVTLSGSTGATIALTKMWAASKDGNSIALTGTSGTIGINTTAVGISSLTCTPTNLTPNTAAQCALGLSGPAGTGGVPVSLSSGSSSVSVPSSITVAAGSSTATFAATAGAFTTSQTVAITASANGSSRAATLTLTAPFSPSALQCAAASLLSNVSTTCTVTISTAAPAGGSLVSLSDTSSALTIPASVTVPAGATQATFTASAGAITATQAVTITASLNGSSKTATLTLTGPLSLSTLGCASTRLPASASTTCTVTLSAAAPAGGSLVSLTDTSSVLTVPVAISVPAGATQATFTAGTGSFGSNQTATITASLNGSSKAVSMSLVVISIQSMRCSLSTLSAAACTVSLSTATPANTAVAVTSSSLLFPVPSSVTVPAGAASAIFNSTLATRATSVAVTLTSKLGSASVSITLTLPAFLSTADKTTSLRQPATLSCSPGFVAAGGSTTCELWAASGDLSDADVPSEVTISSSSDHIRVPSTISLRGGRSRVRFEVAADPDAANETAALTARFNDQAVEESLAVLPADAPVLILPGSQTGKPGLPVRFAVKGVDGRDLPVTLSAAQLPAGARFDSRDGAFEWLPEEKDLGSHTITFAAANSLGVVTRKEVAVYVETGAPVIATLENAAAGSASRAACSPGSVATLSGRFLFRGEGFLSAPAGTSTELDGTRVLVNDAYAAVLYASADRIDFQCPAATPGTALRVAVETGAGLSNPMESKMEATTPGIFAVPVLGRQQAIATHSQSGELASIPNFRLRGSPAIAGESISIGATGIQCSGNPGQQVLLRFGSSPARIDSIQPDTQAAGVCRLAATVPSFVVGDAVPVTLEVVDGDGSVRSSNQASIAVENRR